MLLSRSEWLLYSYSQRPHTAPSLHSTPVLSNAGQGGNVYINHVILLM